jgi:hypothetical protein
MNLVVVVPDEPLPQVTVLLFEAVRGVEIHVKTAVLQSVMELLNLPIVFGMVRFISDVLNPCERTRKGEARAPLAPAVCADCTDDKRSTDDDIMKKCNGTVLIAVFVEPCECKPRTIIEAIERHSLRGSAPRETRIHLNLFSHFFFHVQLRHRTRQSLHCRVLTVPFPDAKDRYRMHAVLLRQSCCDVVDIPVVMLFHHVKHDRFRFIRAPVPCPASLRSGLLGEQSIDTGCFEACHPVIDGETAFLHGTGSVRDGNLAGEDTFNKGGFHGGELVSVVGFHASTLNDECVRLIAAIRTSFVKNVDNRARNGR